MDNYLLLKKTAELKELSKGLGFAKTLFVDDDFVLIKAKSKKELVRNVKAAKKKTVYYPESEELLRFALEKVPVNVVMGMESINLQDSVHYGRGGLDQVTCKIAAVKGKIIGFSFSDILNDGERPRLMTRMKLNIKLCRKFGVKILFSNFSKSIDEVRSAKDLEAFFRVLSKGKGDFSIET
jgi:RNase P/RNase MRP subunit p30